MASVSCNRKEKSHRTLLIKRPNGKRNYHQIHARFKNAVKTKKSLRDFSIWYNFILYLPTIIAESNVSQQCVHELRMYIYDSDIASWRSLLCSWQRYPIDGVDKCRISYGKSKLNLYSFYLHSVLTVCWIF